MTSCYRPLCTFSARFKAASHAMTHSRTVVARPRAPFFAAELFAAVRDMMACSETGVVDHKSPLAPHARAQQDAMSSYEVRSCLRLPHLKGLAVVAPALVQCPKQLAYENSGDCNCMTPRAETDWRLQLQRLSPLAMPLGSSFARGHIGRAESAFFSLVVLVLWCTSVTADPQFLYSGAQRKR